MQLAPYLYFPGTCADALKLYETVFGGKSDVSLFKDMPPQEGMPAVNPEGVMHATFTTPSFTFMASDGRPGAEYHSGNVSLSIATSVAEGTPMFEALSEGATDVMPLQKMFWGATFGQLTDKYGIDWMFNLS